ncbi:hypothetical protein G6O69_25140 [Pseudenhygromyxa sp. WMMC2535]|uniref:hypothetical protein n=1 Tax=Pseudenhygromyxa sp. WMMC2535 TaxID=2712867 RepID=UPI0015523EEA|nr:hypothetical protein [Pseudenhygromyxa sp. WMMC2535]NVB41150.1 hypothetical protein [Pseudenhygromyxa sp. WMMC2535]
MTAKRRTNALAALLLVPTLGMSSGCALLDALTETSAVVDVFATSHGEPDDEGNLPSRNGHQVIFVNDMGWEIFIDDAVITTEGVTLRSCDGEDFEVEFYWGALAETFDENPDYDVTGLGGVRATTGQYCDALVDYGPSAEGMDNPAAEGSTVFLSGSAVKGDMHIDFEWRTDLALTVDVDVSKIQNGRPFDIQDGASSAKKLTIAKSYTGFFAGIDFEDELSQADVDSLLIDTLQQTTLAYAGTIAPQ